MLLTLIDKRKTIIYNIVKQKDKYEYFIIIRKTTSWLTCS